MTSKLLVLQGIESTEDPMQLPSVDEVYEAYVRFVLERVKGNKSKAAAILGIDRRTLYRSLAKWGEHDPVETPEPPSL